MGDGEKEVWSILESSEKGATITDIVKKTSLSRGVVRIALAKLEGAGKILFREVGMAKLYFVY